MNWKYQLKVKGYLHIIQQLQVKSWYRYQITQQKLTAILSKQAVEINLVYSQLNSDNSINEPTDPEEATLFWKDISAPPIGHNSNE